jgi:hypothetical protein
VDQRSGKPLYVLAEIDQRLNPWQASNGEEGAHAQVVRETKLKQSSWSLLERARSATDDGRPLTAAVVQLNVLHCGATTLNDPLDRQ